MNTFKGIVQNMIKKDREEVRSHEEGFATHSHGIFWLSLVSIIVGIFILYFYPNIVVIFITPPTPQLSIQLERDCRLLAQKLNGTFDQIDPSNRAVLFSTPTNCKICIVKDSGTCLTLDDKRACLPGSISKDCKWYEIQ